jgi:tRNA G18 (ribose-2'-O)-methylase SpoU
MTSVARPETVEDPADPRLDPFRSLRAAPGSPRRREKDTGHVVIEGLLALQNALKGPLEPESVLVASNRLGKLPGITEGLGEGVELLAAHPDVIEAVTGFDAHRGVLASAPRPAPLDPAVVLARCRRVAVLTGLGDLENTGAAFRVAAALGLEGVLLDDRCADPLYRRCVRVSLGWSTVVPHARLPADSTPVTLPREAGFTTVALTPRRGSVAVDTAARDGLLDDPVAFLVGAEGPGLDEATIRDADAQVAIPMANGVDSLNAATALAVVGSFASATRGWT